MNNEVKSFTNSKFDETLRTVTKENGEVWFVAKDVATALGYTKTENAIRTHVWEEDKAVTLIQGDSQKREMVVINQSGMFALVFGSKLKKAKEFKHWVTSEVLPSLIENGFYSTSNKLNKAMLMYAEVSMDLIDQQKENENLKIEMETIKKDVAKRGVWLNGESDDLYRGKTLPVYTPTHLLKLNKYRAGLTSKFNKRMIELGYAKRVRVTNGAYTVVLTKKGKRFGGNAATSSVSKQKFGRYYKETFRDLLNEIGFQEYIKKQ